MPRTHARLLVAASAGGPIAKQEGVLNEQAVTSFAERQGPIDTRAWSAPPSAECYRLAHCPVWAFKVAPVKPDAARVCTQVLTRSEKVF